MPYGISAYGQSPQIGSPLQHTGTLVQQHMGTGTATIYAGSESNGSPAAVVSSTALQTTSSQSTTSLFRTGEEKRLTREAMERYLRDRNDMIIVVLHAKVNNCRRLVEVIIVCISTNRDLENNCRHSHHFSDFSTYSFQLSSSCGLSLGRDLCFANFRIEKSFLFDERKNFSINYVVN